VQRKVSKPEDDERAKNFEEQSVTNVVLMSLPVVGVIGILVYFGVVFTDYQSFDHFNISILICVLAALVEGLCEPFYVAILIKMEFSTRAKAEGLAILVKSVMIYFLVWKGFGLLAYAAAQLAYSFMLLATYYSTSMGSPYTFTYLPVPANDKHSMSRYCSPIHQ